MSNKSNEILKNNTLQRKSINVDFITGIILSILTVGVMTLIYYLPKTEGRVLTSFVTGLFGVSAVISFRRANYRRQ